MIHPITIKGNFRKFEQIYKSLIEEGNDAVNNTKHALP